jgi:hypothetical protein
MTCTKPANVDVRESLCNDRRTGSIAGVSLPLARITRLHGIMTDLDPKVLAPGNMLFPPADDPAQFFHNIRAALDRHPLLRDAEVRSSGTGLHAVLWIDPPVELMTEADQQRWGALVEVVQRSLPSDPDAPGIIAMTRPVGSTNGKNGATVRVLKAGKSVSQSAVDEFAGRLQEAPFKVVAETLLGTSRASPCPLCRGPGSQLSVLDRVGKCYGCGNVSLERLFDAAYAPNAGGDGAEAPQGSN